MRAALGVVLVVLAAGCGSGSDEEPDSQGAGVFDPMLETIDRAESVQQTLDDQAAELRRRIEEAEGGREE